MGLALLLPQQQARGAASAQQSAQGFDPWAMATGWLKSHGDLGFLAALGGLAVSFALSQAQNLETLLRLFDRSLKPSEPPPTTRSGPTGDNSPIIPGETFRLGLEVITTSESIGKQTDQISTSPRTIRIFLASSSELIEDRNSFDLFCRQENDRLLKQGLYLEIFRWEHFLDAMSELRLQDEYNAAIKDCDVFVSLFQTKTGKFTREEFFEAHKTFRTKGKPLIYTYFKRSDVPNDRRLRGSLNSLWDFQDKLSELGHFHTEYINTQDLQLQFRRQLDMLIDKRKL
ncbi:MAG: hypothetical protein ACK6BG_07125 [Cyanobacteriota bacterium]